MGPVVYVPFAASVAVAALSRIGSGRLWPRAAVLAIAAAATTLTISAVGALVLLACPLPAQVPLIASLGRWRPRAVASHLPTPMPVSVVALLLLALLAWRVVNELGALAAELRDVSRLRRAIRGRSHGAIVVIDDDTPAAHAVGGVVGYLGTVVITSSMVELLDGDELAAVVAHERAHLRQHHWVFIALIRLCAALNPIVAGTRTDMRFALERWADEDAAATVDRPVLAGALAKAALGVLNRHGSRSITPAPAFHSHGVVDRVAALLADPNRRSRPAWAFVALAFTAAIAFAWATHNTERFFEAARVWSNR